MFQQVAAIVGAAVIGVVPGAHKSPPVHRHVVVSEQYVEYGGRINVRRGDRLDMVMSMATPSPIEIESAATRCNNRGGEPIMYPPTWNYKPLRNVMVCEGINF